jgi:hypothetical protein
MGIVGTIKLHTLDVSQDKGKAFLDSRNFLIQTRGISPSPYYQVGLHDFKEVSFNCNYLLD